MTTQNLRKNARTIAAGSRRTFSSKGTSSRSALPAAGPQWCGTVMGSGILATLTQLHSEHLPVGQLLTLVFFVIAWSLLLGISGAFAARAARHPGVVRQTREDTAVLVTWGMVSMGILSVGSATATVVPARWPEWAGLAWGIDSVLWWGGTVLGVVTAAGFALRLIGGRLAAPATTWGLPVVPPMVSATTGAALVVQLDSRAAQVWMLMATVCCFFLALTLGVFIFAVAYHHHWRVTQLSVGTFATAWIPLGIVGQSTAAAQAIAQQAQRFVRESDAAAVQQIANAYGCLMLAIGLPLVCWAMKMTVRGLRERVPFVPGWWALTFPVGTLQLGKHEGFGLFAGISVFFYALLLFHWSLCARATCLALRS